jgi:hypothetical protein
MIKLFLLVLLANSVFADETVNCEENKISLEATSLAENFAEKDCTREIDIQSFTTQITKIKSAQKFCKDCVVTPFGSEQTQADIEKYAGAVVGEFKKELTFITQDLLKIRESSFKLDSTISCNLDLLKPKDICENGKAAIGKTIKSLKESLGNELADTFKPNKTPLNGLLKRKPLLCDKMNQFEVSDQGILAAKTKYLESLLTPDFISNLNKQLEKDREYKNDDLDILKKHPIFQDIANSPVAFKEFLNSALKAKDNNEIIKIMNEKAKKGNFSKKISERCQESISKVATALKTIYCEETTLFIENKSGFDKLTNSKNEFSTSIDNKHFKSFCLDLNRSNQAKDNKSKVFNFNQFAGDLNKNIPIEKQPESWATFHDDAHRTFYNEDKETICKLMPPAIPGCEDSSLAKTQHCQMLKFLKESDKPGGLNLASNESHDSVNNIFRTMISGAEFTPETQSTLKDAGILPGGKSSDTKDTGYFYDKSTGKSVASSSMPAFNNGKQGNQAPLPNGKKQFDQEQNNQASFQTPNIGSNSNPRSNEEESSPKLDPTQKNIMDKLLKSRKKSSVVSNDDMNALKRTTGSKKLIPTNKAEDEDQETDSLNPAFYPTDKGTAVDNTRVYMPKPNVSSIDSSNKAKIDQKKVDKDASLKEAMLQAQTRSPASTSIQNTTIALTKTDGKNQIEIKVTDESKLDDKIPDFEKKDIKEFLDTSGLSLQGAKLGEEFIVKLGKFKITVALNEKGIYEATCQDTTLHPDYLNFLTEYFKGIKSRVNGRETMNKFIKEETKIEN